MKTFIYTAVFDKTGRSGGRRVVVSVWQIKRNKPEFIGSEKANTAAWDGASLIAHRMISEKTGAKLGRADRLPDHRFTVIELKTVQK